MEEIIKYAKRYTIVKHDINLNTTQMLNCIFTDHYNALYFMESSAYEYIQKQEGEKTRPLFTEGKDSEEDLPLGHYMSRNNSNVCKISVCEKLKQERTIMKTYYTMFSGWVPTIPHERPKTITDVVCRVLFSLEVVEIPSNVCSILTKIECEDPAPYDVYIPEKQYFDSKAAWKRFSEELAALNSMAQLNARFEKLSDSSDSSETIEPINLPKIRSDNADEFINCTMAKKWSS